MKKTIGTFLFLFLIMGLFAGGQADEENMAALDDYVDRISWTESTHGNDTEPNYTIVFNQTEVMEFHITIDSDDWQAMQDDLEANLAGEEFDKASGGARVFGNNRPPAGGDVNAPAVRGPGKGVMPENPQVMIDDIDFDPIWVSGTVSVDDVVWEHVGIRFKGNSSLRSTVISGNRKLSFKLDFDEFEDEYPEIEDQRFYGFKQLNLNNNYNDQSLMREKVSADLFREFGVVSAQTAFCTVYVDYGEGSRYFGVYTLVEEIDDTVVEAQLEDNSGNLYKPEGSAASFADGTYNEDEMGRKNNEDDSNYSDVRALYTILNSDDRSFDSESWKSDLEAIFNVDGFLRWLAANTVMQNWDTYGNMTHNYFLYNDLKTGLLNWIPWDNNEALQEGKASGALSLSLSEVTERWPLIRYIIDDPEYKAVYDAYVGEFVENVFNPDKLDAVFDTNFELIKEYAYAEVDGYSFLRSNLAFNSEVDALKAHVIQRCGDVVIYLGN